MKPSEKERYFQSYGKGLKESTYLPLSTTSESKRGGKVLSLLAI